MRNRRPMIWVVVLSLAATAIGIAIVARDRLVPGSGVERRGRHRHALRRPADRLGADLRARDGGRPLLGLRLPREAGRHRRRRADPRQHPARGHLGDDPADHRHRARRLRLDRARRHRGEEGRHARRPRDRPAVRLELRVPGPGQAAVEPARAAEGPPGPLQDQHQGRPARLLGAGVPAQVRRRPGHHDRRPAHTRRGSAATRSSAPSCAASATRRCARRCAWSRPRTSTPGSPSSSRATRTAAWPPPAATRSRRGASSSPTPAATPATRSPTPARPPPSAPSSTTSRRRPPSSPSRRARRRPST